MRVLTLAVARGGTGKTTGAINLAAQLAELLAGDGLRVALLDLDPQATATLAMGQAAHSDPLRAPAGVPEGEAFALYPGGRTLALATAEQVADRIRAVARTVDILVVDTAPAMSPATLAALRCASLVVVPIEPSQLSLPGMADVAAVLETLKREDRLRVLLSRVRATRRLTRDVAEYVADHYPGALLPVVIPEDVRAAEQIPVRGAQSNAAGAFQELAGILRGDLR